jgi:hypothetical protein
MVAETEQEMDILTEEQPYHCQQQKRELQIWLIHQEPHGFPSPART